MEIKSPIFEGHLFRIYLSCKVLFCLQTQFLCHWQCSHGKIWYINLPLTSTQKCCLDTRLCQQFELSFSVLRDPEGCPNIPGRADLPSRIPIHPYPLLCSQSQVYHYGTAVRWIWCSYSWVVSFSVLDTSLAQWINLQGRQLC